MKLFFHVFPLVTLLSCATSEQGIKVRAQSPPIDEAFRKMSLALTADGYMMEKIDPAQHTLETGWREMKEKEKSTSDTARQTLGESRIGLRMSHRGTFYEVVVTPMLRHDGGMVTVADLHHPLREKWQRIIHTLLERESRDED